MTSGKDDNIVVTGLVNSYVGIMMTIQSATTCRPIPAEVVSCQAHELSVVQSESVLWTVARPMSVTMTRRGLPG